MSNQRIKELVEVYPVKAVCKVLGVSRSAVYQRKRAQESGHCFFHQRQDARLSKLVKALFRENREVYGRPRLMRCLTNLGVHISGKRLARSMREQGISAKKRRRFKQTTDNRHGKSIAPNLLKRDFKTSAPDRVWCSDITYIRTWDGWMYLCVIIDLFSRKVVGWSMADHMETSLVRNALAMALGRRSPRPGLVFHSDRGSQYASRAFRQDLRHHGIVQSMSRAGDCWDNAVVERLNDKLKQELVFRSVFRRKGEVELPVIECIERFYHNERLHSSLDYMTPSAVEREYFSGQRAAA